jgi:lysozyme
MRSLRFALTALILGLCQNSHAEEFSRQELFQLVRTEASPPTANEALPKAFSFPDNARESSVFGVDTSHHTEDNCRWRIDWLAVAKQSVKFAYLKATQGTSYVDPTFQRNWQAIKAVQNQSQILYAGAYHFITADDDPSLQAKHFEAQIGHLADRDLPPSLDLEWDLREPVVGCQQDAIVTIKRADGTQVSKCDFWGLVSPDEIINRVLALANDVKMKTGKNPALYTNAAWWKARVRDPAKFLQVRMLPIWIADYSSSGLATEIPAVPHGEKFAIWQFSERAVLGRGGIPGRVDANIFPGLISDMHRVFNLPN